MYGNVGSKSVPIMASRSSDLLPLRRRQFPRWSVECLRGLNSAALQKCFGVLSPALLKPRETATPDLDVRSQQSVTLSAIRMW